MKHFSIGLLKNMHVQNVHVHVHTYSCTLYTYMNVYVHVLTVPIAKIKMPSTTCTVYFIENYGYFNVKFNCRIL